MTETEKKMQIEHVEFVRQIKIKTSKLVLSTGLNVAHDYDGVESEADCFLYLDAVLREFEKKTCFNNNKSINPINNKGLIL